MLATSLALKQNATTALVNASLQKALHRIHPQSSAKRAVADLPVPECATFLDRYAKMQRNGAR